MNDTTYLGILCRTCRELVAFDTAPYPSFGPRASNLKPGAIRCSQGHNHIYFPGDFQFHRWHLRITGAVMEQNRAAYSAINLYSTFGTQDTIPPKTEPATSLSPPKENIELRPHVPSDSRREGAQMAAKNRWAKWALKKIS